MSNPEPISTESVLRLQRASDQAAAVDERVNPVRAMETDGPKKLRELKREREGLVRQVRAITDAISELETHLLVGGVEIEAK